MRASGRASRKSATMRYATRILLAGLAAAVLAVPGLAQTGRASTPETFSANAINMSMIGDPRPTPLDITITSWTTPADQERYISILRDKGGDEMVEALRQAPSIGSIRTPTSLAYDFRYAVQERTK